MYYYFLLFKQLFIPAILFFSITFSGCNSSADKSTDTSASSVQQPDEWEFLSGDRNLWHTYGKDSMGSAWKIEDSALHLDASVKSDWQTKDGGDIVTNNEYENFNLQLNWKISEGGNSGIMIYVHEDTSKYKYPWESGPEIQVADNEKNEDGKIYKSRAGDVYELIPSTSQQFVKPAGEWNHMEIIANKGKLDSYMNGEHVLSATLWDDAWKKSIDSTKFKTMTGFGTFRRGKIGLQDHGADVWYKDVKIKKL
jgi:hypothetical protein